MTTTISLPRTGRPLAVETFADLTTAPVQIQRFPNGAVTLTFDGDLADETRAAVIRRAGTSADAEPVIREDLWRAIEECRTYLSKQAPTAAESTAQVRLLSRMMIGVVRLVLRRLDRAD